MIVFWSIVTALVLIHPAPAQETGGGGIRAVIRDEGGNPIPDVTLVIEAGGHRRWLRAGPDGSFAGELPKGFQLVGMTPPCYVVARVATEAESMRLTLRRTPFDTSAVEPRSGATSTLSASFDRGMPVRPVAANPVFTSLSGGVASGELSKSQAAAATKTPANSFGDSRFTSSSNLFRSDTAGRILSFTGGNYNFNATFRLQSSYGSVSNLSLSSRLTGSSNLSSFSSFSSFSSPTSSFSSMTSFGNPWNSRTWSSVYSPISSTYSPPSPWTTIRIPSSPSPWTTITNHYPPPRWEPPRFPAKGIQVVSDFDCRKLAEDR